MQKAWNRNRLPTILFATTAVLSIGSVVPSLAFSCLASPFGRSKHSRVPETRLAFFGPPRFWICESSSSSGLNFLHNKGNNTNDNDDDNDMNANNPDNSTMNWQQSNSLLAEETKQRHGIPDNYPFLNEDGYEPVVDQMGYSAIQNRTLPYRGEEYEGFVRLQNGPDPDVKGISTRQEIEARIAKVKTIQSKLGVADLYDRQWQAVDGTEAHKVNVAVNGAVNGGSSNDPSISVLQFNILAEGLSAGPESKTPFPMQEEKSKENDYGGFTQLPNPETVLNFDLRKWRLMEVLLEFNCDILAIEEMDRFHGFFEPLLKAMNYEGLFIPKLRAPGIPLGWYSDGCSLFFRADKFELQTSQERLVYSVGTQVLIIASLLHKPTKKTIVVAVTHLKARRTDKNEAIRRAQVNELLETLNNFTARNTSPDPWPVLVLGDFNADPPTQATKAQSAVQLMVDQYKSAYDLVDDPNLVTTWKKRGNEVQRVIDYIFYSPDLINCTHTLSIPHEQLATETYKLPNLRYPSDHLMIAAKFSMDFPSSSAGT